MSIRGVLVAVVLLVGSGIAAAQPVVAALAPPPTEPPPPNGPPTVSEIMRPPPPPVRAGLFGGGGLWAGNISCDGTNCGDFRKAGGGNGHIGWMFSPRFGVLVDVWAMTSSENNVSLTFLTTTVNVRYWLANAIWIQGGVGNGHAIVRVGGFQGRGDDVPVVEAAAGFEIVRGRNWAVDVGLKVAQGSTTVSEEDNVQTGRSTALGAHFTFFGMR